MKNTMRAIAKTNKGIGVSLIEVPAPKPKNNEVLIKIKRSAICGTDIHFFNWTKTGQKFLAGKEFPVVIGHELSGVIVDVGTKADENRIGQRVSFETHPYCGECAACRIGNKHVCFHLNDYGIYRNGGFAEFKVAPENTVYVLPENVSFEQGALYEPGGVAMYAFEDSQMNPGDGVVVYGCGYIGLMVMQIFRACGAGTVIGLDINEFRLNIAKEYADVTINPMKEPAISIINETLSAHGGADIIIEATGASSVYDQIFKIARPGASIILLGHPNDNVSINIMDDINMKNLTIKGHYGRSIWSSWDKLNALVSKNQIDLESTVTHTYTLSQYQEAFEMSTKDSVKILFNHEIE